MFKVGNIVEIYNTGKTVRIDHIEEDGKTFTGTVVKEPKEEFRYTSKCKLGSTFSLYNLDDWRKI